MAADVPPRIGPSTISRAPSSRLESQAAARVGVSLLYAAAVIAVFAADYLSSWLPNVAGFPAGAIVRDLLAGLLIVAGVVAVARSERPATSVLSGSARAALIPISFLAVWALVLIPAAPATVPAMLSVRNLILYPAVALAVAALWERNLIGTRTIVLTLGGVAAVAATLGILDTMTHGSIVELLGYRRDYSGTGTGGSRLVAGTQGAFNGVVRASGGISNSLVFGYLMSLFAIGATWWLAARGAGMRPRARVLVTGFAILVSVACVASLTRGAWLVLLVGLAAVVITNRSRRVVGLTATILVATAAITIAMSPVVPTGHAVGAGGLVGAVTDRAGSSDDVSQESSGLRLDQLRDGVIQLARSPLGTGLGSEGAASERAGTVDRVLVPDIYVLIVGLQTGLPGLVLWLGVFGMLAAWALRHLGSTDASLVVALLLAMAVASTLSASPDAPPFALAFWLLALAVPALGTSRLAGSPTPAT